MSYTNWIQPYKKYISKVVYTLGVCIICYKLILIYSNENINSVSAGNLWNLESKTFNGLVQDYTYTSPASVNTKLKLFPQDNERKDKTMSGKKTISLQAIDSPQLITYIKRYVIELPAPFEVSLNLDKPSEVYFSQIGQDKIVEKILNHKRNGFFIESGAQNGEKLSNTLYFERNLNWTGLLVEPSPHYYKLMKRKNRKAYTTNTCLSTKPYPMKVDFNGHQIFQPGVSMTAYRAIAKVQCYPLFSLLLAMDPPIFHIDYFSLDVDGPELEILQTIPWNKLSITVISVEVRHHPFQLNREITSDIVNYVTSKGYHYVVHSFDIIFIKDGTEYDRKVVNRMLIKTIV